MSKIKLVFLYFITFVIILLGTTSCKKNVAPVANDDVLNTLEDVSATIDVLSNDTDKDGGVLTIDSFANGGHGTVSREIDLLKYTPDSNFCGQDQFTYGIIDESGVVDTAIVTVNVAPVMTIRLLLARVITLMKMNSFSSMFCLIPPMLMVIL
jgi:hypothetical protein